MSGTGVGDVLLRWLSERGSGRSKDLRDGVSAMAKAHRLPVHNYADWNWVRSTSALGMLDTDARADRWSVAPAVLTRLPFADGTALLTGARTGRLAARLDQAAADWLDVLEVPAPATSDEVPLPSSVLIQYDDPDSLPETARRLGVRYTPCAATQLAAVLPQLAPGSAAVGPIRADECQLARLDAVTGRFRPVPRVLEDGLYRWQGGDRTRVFRLHRSGAFLATEREAGIYLELSHTGSNLLRWEAEGGAGRQRTGRLFVDERAPLPPLHARTAVLCSGLPPLPIERPGRDGRVFAHDNVPFAVAEAIAVSLGQRLAHGITSNVPSAAASAPRSTK